MIALTNWEAFIKEVNKENIKDGSFTGHISDGRIVKLDTKKVQKLSDWLREHKDVKDGE